MTGDGVVSLDGMTVLLDRAILIWDQMYGALRTTFRKKRVQSMFINLYQCRCQTISVRGLLTVRAVDEATKRRSEGRAVVARA